MMDKQQEVFKLEIVGHEKKEWEVYDKQFGTARLMPFFPLVEGHYRMQEQDGKWFLVKQCKSKSEYSIVMYQELIDQLQSGGTILVDEDILQIPKSE